MRNGVVDYFEMSGLGSRLDKIIKLRKKYDSTDTIISVDDRISIEFSKHKICYVCVNGNRAIKYKYGYIGVSVSAIATGATGGILKGPIRFVTTDKTIANHTFIKETSTLLKNSLGKIERDLQQASKTKWGIDTDNIAMSCGKSYEKTVRTVNELMQNNLVSGIHMVNRVITANEEVAKSEVNKK